MYARWSNSPWLVLFTIVFGAIGCSTIMRPFIDLPSPPAPVAGIANVILLQDSTGVCFMPVDFANCPADVLAKYLAPAGRHGTGMLLLSNNQRENPRVEWTLAGSWTQTQDFGPWQAGPGAAGTTYLASGPATATLIPAYGDTVVVYGEAAIGDAGWDVTVDETWLGTVGGYIAGRPAVYRAALATSAGWHTLSLSPHQGGNAHVYAAEWTSGVSGVSIHNMSHGYFRSEAFGFAVERQLAYIGTLSPVPTAAILALGINDSINGTGVTQAGYQGNLQNVVDKLKSINPQMSILIVDEHNVVGGDSGVLPQTLIRVAESDLAVSNGLNFVSFPDYLGSEAQASANGLMYSDGIHLTDKGGRAEGEILYAALLKSLPYPLLRKGPSDARSIAPAIGTEGIPPPK